MTPGLLALAVGSPLDPTSEEARRLLEEELAKPGYRTQLGPLEQLQEWLNQLLQGAGGAAFLPAWLVPVVLAILLAVVALIIARVVRRDAVVGRRGPGAVLAEAGIDAQTYAARARSALAAGDPSAALLDAYRSIVTGAVERTVLVDLPGRTAHEAGEELAASFPGLADRLRSAAGAFDEVRYAERPATPQRAEAVLTLAGEVEHERPRFGEVVPG